MLFMVSHRVALYCAIKGAPAARGVLWDKPVSFEQMKANLEAWCELADECGLTPIKRMAATLRNNAVGVCNYARYPISNARVEAGNVAIGLFRKRTRGIKNLKYFILKIFQISTQPDEHAWLSSGHDAGLSIV